MIFDRERIAKLSGLMTEAKDGSEKAKAKASDFGGGKIDKEQFLSGEVTTESAEEEDAMEESDVEEEAAVREMIQAELAAAKNEVRAEMREEQAVREAVRKEIRSVLRSRGVTLGGTGFGFRR